MEPQSSTQAILFIDDEEGVRRSVRRALKREPYSIYTAGDGRAAFPGRTPPEEKNGRPVRSLPGAGGRSWNGRPAPDRGDRVHFCGFPVNPFRPTDPDRRLPIASHAILMYGVYRFAIFIHLQ